MVRLVSVRVGWAGQVKQVQLKVVRLVSLSLGWAGPRRPSYQASVSPGHHVYDTGGIMQLQER